MSKYTIELRCICEQAAGVPNSMGYNSVGDIISKSIPKIFDFNFPIFDENYRNVLETKILKHFYTREIAFETVGLWKLKLDTKLNEIMPYYNQMYESELLEFDPLSDMKITKTDKRTVTGTTDTTGTANSNATNTGKNKLTGLTSVDGQTDRTEINKDAFSETPQGSLQNIENMSYLTTGRIINNTGNDTVNNTTNITNTTDTNVTDTSKTDTTTATNAKTVDDFIETLTGKQGTHSYSELLNEFRNSFLNIDMLIIDELDELFFGLW